MVRTAETLGFSVPPQLKKEIEEIAKKEGRTKSELFREMVKAYKELQFEKEFFNLQRSLTRKARKKGIYTEADIERLIFEDR